MSKVVINTSPWIALSILELTDILTKLFSEIYMPNPNKSDKKITNIYHREHEEHEEYHRE